MAIEHKIGKAAKKDKQFMQDFKQTGNTTPSFFSDKLDWGLFASTYCGYLIGKHGPAEADRLYQQIK